MHYQQRRTRQDGFTLIELLIVTSLTVMLLLTITTMFMTFLVSNSKTNIRKSVKEEGLHALSQIEFIIKNARYYDDTFQACGTGLNTIRVVGLDGGVTTYSTSNGKIASNSATLNSNLTSDAVTLSGLTFDCSGDTGNRQIKVTFSLSKNAPTLSADSVISEPFETLINMRN